MHVRELADAATVTLAEWTRCSCAYKHFQVASHMPPGVGQSSAAHR